MSDQAAPGMGWEEAYLGGSPQAEQKVFAEIMPQLEQIQTVVAKGQGAAVRRGFHNKGTSLRIAFEVSTDLPEHLQVGFLKPGARYEGFARFSRSQSKFAADSALDQRGFAFRIETDDGPQDFLFSNTPVSYAEDPVTFLKGGLIFASSSKATIPIKLMLAFGLRKGIRILKDILGSPDRGISFTSQRFWTRVAFQIGFSAASFTVVPVPDEPVVVADQKPDYLTHHLAEQLRQGERRFVLNTQLFVSEDKTPIENSNGAWNEEDSPLVPIGEVILVQQDLDSEAAKALAERIESTEAFNPWNTRHLRPLGAMNRSRKPAYDNSVRARGASSLERES
ncbi:MAG: catalase [Planctomycetota bacterium]